MRLWKGLFYCMWMCDKPLVQEELADNIADLIHSFSTPLGAMGFFDAFLLTMKREWLGIDRLRMDKFFMFIRRCFRQALVVLRNNNWEESVVDRFLEVLCKTPLCGNADASSDGLCYHFIDIYRDEVALCAGQEVGRRFELHPTFPNHPNTSLRRWRIEDCRPKLAIADHRARHTNLFQGRTS